MLKITKRQSRIQIFITGESIKGQSKPQAPHRLFGRISAPGDLPQDVGQALLLEKYIVISNITSRISVDCLTRSHR
ncbi:hypothetical protein PSCT_04393 [Pseudomonas sp. SCT]|nr:hypothetical protein PSCT_04393 [Pseudomonas sp. SCT]